MLPSQLVLGGTPGLRVLHCTLAGSTGYNLVMYLFQGVGGWECPISSSVMRMGTASCQFKNKLPNSDSAVDAMMLRSILHTTYTMPLSVGSKLAGSCGDEGLLLKKCMPPDLLRVFGQDK